MGRTRISLTAALLHFFHDRSMGANAPPHLLYHPNSPSTLTDLIALAHSDCFKGGLSLPPQPLCSFNPPPYQRASGSDLPLGDWARNWGLGKKEQRGPRKGPRLGRCHGVGRLVRRRVCAAGGPCPQTDGEIDRGLGSQLSWAAPSSRGGREKEPQSRWGKERDDPGEVVEAKRSWGVGEGQDRGAVVGLGDPLRGRGV